MKLLYLIIIETIIIYSKTNEEISNNISLRNLIQDTTNTNIFIMTHKDFNNILTKKIYKIVADEPKQLSMKYDLEVLYANNGKLYKKSKAYGEMAKLYYIYEQYKNGTLSSKYIGLNHYRRYFSFLDDIPDFDEIFQNYDIILNNKFLLDVSLETHFCSVHLCKSLNEVIEILKEIKPKYYKTAQESLKSNEAYFGNLFVMRKEDFFKYCSFIFDILLEFDRRHNFTTQYDIINYVRTYFPDDEIAYQMRLEGFLAERLSTIFFKHNFKNIKFFEVKTIESKLDINEERKKIKDNCKIVLFSLMVNWFTLLFKYFLNIKYSRKGILKIK